MERAGWVHLDIKPDNLIMGVPPRIIDLSIARTVERAARTRGVLGTDAYMAPEQCGTPGVGGPDRAGRRRLRPQRDAVARGDGGDARTRAGAATAPEERFPQLVAPLHEPPRDLPAGLVDLLRSGLARDPAERPTARELAAGFEPLMEALPRRAPRGRGRR